jgi:hypothetical protein
MAQMSDKNMLPTVNATDLPTLAAALHDELAKLTSEVRALTAGWLDFERKHRGLIACSRNSGRRGQGPKKRVLNPFT